MSIEVFRVRLRTNSRPLAANETWSQGWQDTYGNEHGHRRVRVDIWADKAGTLYLDQTDNEDYSGVSSTTVSVSALTRAELAWVTISKRFYRVRYVNGGTANVKEPMILLERSAMSTADNSLAGVAQDGTDATGVTPPTGAVGIRGWLSGIYNLLFGGGAKVTVTGSNLTQVQVATGQVVAAGATWNGTPQDMSNAARFAMAGMADGSHAWIMNVLYSATQVSTPITVGLQSGASGGKSADGVVRLTWASPQIVNQDAVQHSYNLWLRKIPV